MRSPVELVPERSYKPNKEQILAAKALVDTLSIDFDCRNFENPDLQQFYSNLQALALGEENPEAVEDTIVPDEEGMLAHQTEINTFIESVWGSNLTNNRVKKSKVEYAGKRKINNEDDIEQTDKRTK